jgi:enterochelin esterase family protein
MKRVLSLMVILLFTLNKLSSGQDIEYSADSRPAPTNAPGMDYPRIDSQNRAIFRVEAPTAGKVQLDLGSLYDMVKSDEVSWRVTTKPLDPGFHYYYLLIDGFRFPDPASKSFFGIGSKEGARMKGLSETLLKAGIHNTYYESPGTAHEWLTWRRCLYQFAPMLFK